MATPFLGQITVFPYSFPPSNWMDCVGQLLPISQYAALFSLLGTAYGGNGTSNFGLPDLQGRIPVGQGTMPGGSIYDMGEEAGSETVSILTAEMPVHNHSLAANNASGTAAPPTNSVLGQPFKSGGHGHPNDTGNIYNTTPPTTTLALTSISQAGGSQPHNNMQPSLGLRYCIAVSGVFPARP